jgi:hypothetical protein
MQSQDGLSMTLLTLVSTRAAIIILHKVCTYTVTTQVAYEEVGITLAFKRLISRIFCFHTTDDCGCVCLRWKDKLLATTI